MKTPAIILILSSACWAKTNILSDNFISQINSRQSSWVAGRNFPENTPLEVLKNLTGGLIDKEAFKTIPKKIHNIRPEDIPESFDSRDNWPQCKDSINTIRDQGRCGSCWAFAVAGTISDRTCIASNGNTKFKYSPEDILSCCTECGSCDGGYPDRALKFWVDNGVVSGGDYNSNEGCQPYLDDPFNNGYTPQCSNVCLNNNYGTSYQNDKRFGSQYYQIDTNIQQIQAEILANGPVETWFQVYDDFYNYQSGVYQYTSGNQDGAHIVRVIGWGTENGNPYWLIANSWGSGWGSLGGFFKILRGQNECGIETYIFTGTPKL